MNHTDFSEEFISQLAMIAGAMGSSKKSSSSSHSKNHRYMKRMFGQVLVDMQLDSSNRYTQGQIDAATEAYADLPESKDDVLSIASFHYGDPDGHTVMERVLAGDESADPALAGLAAMIGDAFQGDYQAFHLADILHSRIGDLAEGDAETTTATEEGMEEASAAGMRSEDQVKADRAAQAKLNEATALELRAAKTESARTAILQAAADRAAKRRAAGIRGRDAFLRTSGTLAAREAALRRKATTVQNAARLKAQKLLEEAKRDEERQIAKARAEAKKRQERARQLIADADAAAGKLGTRATRTARRADAANVKAEKRVATAEKRAARAEKWAAGRAARKARLAAAARAKAASARGKASFSIAPPGAPGSADMDVSEVETAEIDAALGYQESFAHHDTIGEAIIGFHEDAGTLGHCENCGAEGKHSKCSGCNTVSYCGAACQLADWHIGHAAECQQISSGAEWHHEVIDEPTLQRHYLRMHNICDE